MFLIVHYLNSIFYSYLTIHILSNLEPETIANSSDVFLVKNDTICTVKKVKNDTICTVKKVKNDTFLIPLYILVIKKYISN